MRSSNSYRYLKGAFKRLTTRKRMKKVRHFQSAIEDICDMQQALRCLKLQYVRRRDYLKTREWRDEILEDKHLEEIINKKLFW